MIGVIARHESASLLRMAQTWVLAAIVAALMGFLFLQQLERYLAIQPQLALQDHPPGLTGFMTTQFMAPLSALFMALGPLLAMRSFSDEFREQTAALWQSSPVSLTALVLGKFLGVLAVLSGLVLLALAMLALLAAFVQPDAGVMASATLGLMLVSAAGSAIGLYFSSLTRQVMIAIVSAAAFLLLLWFIGSVSTVPLLQGISAMSVTEHLAGFFQGYPGFADVMYWILLTLMFLTLTVIRLDSLQHHDH